MGLGGDARDIVFELIEHIVWHDGQEPTVESPPSHCHNEDSFKFRQPLLKKTEVLILTSIRCSEQNRPPQHLVRRGFTASSKLKQGDLLGAFFALVYKHTHHIPHSRSALHFFTTGGFTVNCFHCSKEDRKSFDLPNSPASTDVLRYNPLFTLTSSLRFPVFQCDAPEQSAPNPDCCKLMAEGPACSGSSVMLPNETGWTELDRRCRGKHPEE